MAVQHEGYASAGWTHPFWAAVAHWAVATAAGGEFGTTHFAGGSARLSPYGDLGLDLSLGFYSDGLVPRIALSWRIPFATRFSVTPGAALQPLGDEVLYSFFGTFAAEVGRWSFLLGGKCGAEERPAYLLERVVYNVPERPLWGLWAGVGVRAGDAVRLTLGYELTRFVPPDGTVEPPTGHFLTLGGDGRF